MLRPAPPIAERLAAEAPGRVAAANGCAPQAGAEELRGGSAELAAVTAIAGGRAQAAEQEGGGSDRALRQREPPRCLAALPRPVRRGGRLRAARRNRSRKRVRAPGSARPWSASSSRRCTSYGNLHDHHIVFRAAGGSDALENRTTLCAWHHLRGVHAGLVRCGGRAPGRLRFDLGLRRGHPPLARHRSGDRLETDPAAV